MKQHACLNPGWVRSFMSDSRVTINIPERIPPLTVDDALESAAAALAEQMSEIRRLEELLDKERVCAPWDNDFSALRAERDRLNAHLEGVRHNDDELYFLRKQVPYLVRERDRLKAQLEGVRRKDEEIASLQEQVSALVRERDLHRDRVKVQSQIIEGYQCDVGQLKGQSVALSEKLERSKADALFWRTSYDSLITRVSSYGLMHPTVSKAIVVTAEKGGWTASRPGHCLEAPTATFFGLTPLSAVRKLAKEQGISCVNTENLAEVNSVLKNAL